MVSHCLFACMYVHHSDVRNNDHHICNNIHQVCWNNAGNKLPVSLYIHRYRHMLFHRSVVYSLDCNHNNIQSVCQRIYDRIDLFQLSHIHQHYNEVAHQTHLYNQQLCYKREHYQCTARCCK